MAGRHLRLLPLQAWLANLHGCSLQPTFFKLHLLVPGHEAPQPVAYPIIGPHTWMEALHKAGPQQFASSACGSRGEEGVLEFWEWAAMQPMFVGHPSWSQPEDLDCMIPWMLHSDGAESFTAQEAIVFSMSSFVSGCSRLVWDNKLLLGILMERSVAEQPVKDEAMKTIGRLLARSFKLCHLGKKPKIEYVHVSGDGWKDDGPDASSVDLAGGWKGCFAGWKGDRKEGKNLFKFHRNYISTYVCELCLAVQPFKKYIGPELAYTNHWSTALWRQTVMTDKTIALCQRETSPFACIPGFNVWLLWEDLMHTVHLGMAKDGIMSLVAELLLESALTDADTLATLQVELETYCTLHRMQRPPRKLSLKLIRWGGSKSVFPCLSTLAKAAHTKTILFWCADAAYDRGEGSRHCRLRNCCFYGLADFLFTLDQAGDIMSPDMVRQASRSAHISSKSYQALAVEAFKSRQPWWKVRPKNHYFTHIWSTTCVRPIAMRAVIIASSRKTS